MFYILHFCAYYVALLKLGFPKGKVPEEVKLGLRNGPSKTGLDFPTKLEIETLNLLRIIFYRN